MLYILGIMSTTVITCLFVLTQNEYMQYTLKCSAAYRGFALVFAFFWTALAIWFSPWTWLIISTAQLFMFLKGFAIMADAVTPAR